MKYEECNEQDVNKTIVCKVLTEFRVKQLFS